MCVSVSGCVFSEGRVLIFPTLIKKFGLIADRLVLLKKEGLRQDPLQTEARFRQKLTGIAGSPFW